VESEQPESAPSFHKAKWLLLLQHKYSPAVCNFLKWSPTDISSFDIHSQLEKTMFPDLFPLLKFMYFNPEVHGGAAAGI